MNSICLNGRIIPAGKPVLMAGNRSYRYGDGLFETMKIIDREIPLEAYHFERFFSGLNQMAFDIPASTTSEKIKAGIISLCEQNKCEIYGRVRLSAFRGNGGLYDDDNTLQYLVECAPVDASVSRLNQNGLVIDVYPGARKTGDSFSNLKSANFLPYVMAARYAKQNNWDDCLVLNTSGRIADATIANIFLVKDGRLTTPALAEGCVSGVMRRWLIESYPVREAALMVEDLLSADELFLTNAVQGIKWVKQFRTKTLANTMAAKIHNELVTSLWT